MPETDLALLIRAAMGAGEVAMRYAGPSARSWDKPDGAGPVTEADLAANDHLQSVLLDARPKYGWLSEETDDTPARLEADTVFIVDPIDGTRNFIDGGRTWAHSIAVARKGRVEAGVVYLPMRDRLYAAARGTGALLNGEPLSARGAPGPKRTADVLSARVNLNRKFWSENAPVFTPAYRPSLAYRLALVAQGRFDGMLTFRPTWEWDIAAGSLIVEEAGAMISDRRGASLVFNARDPRSHGVITASPELHAAFVKAHRAEA